MTADDTAARIASRAIRVMELAGRICSATTEREARLWARDLKRATNELHERVRERCEVLAEREREHVAG